MKTLATHFGEVVNLQSFFLKEGFQTIFTLFEFKTVLGLHFQSHNCYKISPKSPYPEFKLFFKSVEILDAMPDGEYRVYNYIFNLDDNNTLKCQHLCYFFIKNGNQRSYILHDVSLITELYFKTVLKETEKQGHSNILFQKIS